MKIEKEKASVSGDAANADSTVATSPKARSKNTPPPPEIEQLSEALKQHDKLSSEIKKLGALAAHAQKEIEEFTANGDVSDLKRIAQLTAFHLQTVLVDRRIQALNESLGGVEEKLVGLNKHARGVVSRLLHRVVKLHVDKMTETFKPHFPSVEEARLKAERSTRPMEAEQQSINFNLGFPQIYEYEAHNPHERAAGILRWFKKAEGELSALEDQNLGSLEPATK
jgi:hypothetical protein